MATKHTKCIAIDFDHTLHDARHPLDGRRMGPPILGAKEALETLRERGYKVIIHSCNRPKVIRAWMEYYKIPFDSIWGEHASDIGKPAADFYCDDSAITFTNDWDATVKLLLSAKADPLGVPNGE